ESYPDIFYKVKKNRFEGPFDACEMRKKRFLNGSTPIYFMKNGERPNGDTPFHTLNELRALNGA
ncbi:hypothetical protein PMAYCL1PPCAC_00504, partial [Pristionchus mayeri]